jgi:hypothetical protein
MMHGNDYKTWRRIINCGGELALLDHAEVTDSFQFLDHHEQYSDFAMKRTDRSNNDRQNYCTRISSEWENCLSVEECRLLGCGAV